MDSEALSHTQIARVAREALVGKTIAGRYVLRGLLGHGGMGAVYEAEHLGLGKRVAIKFVDPEFATDERVVARFAREARAMSAIESAHIVTVFDAGTEDGRPYLVMELLRGEDLGQRLRRTRRVALAEAMHIVAQVLKGLARAHAAGIVHRDLKPDNVFLIKHDTDPLFAKIVDFGISKIERPRANTSPLALTGRGTVLGTPFYMSPEQAQASSEVDGRTDLYSVGAILFECLTGRPPHTGESYEQIILSICMRDAPSVRAFDADLPEDVAAFVARALTRDRVQRFTSAERMLAALHDVAPAERTRVPLDPPSAATLASPSPSSPSFDEVSAVTRLGVGSLEPATVQAIADAKAAEQAAEKNPAPEAEKETRPEGMKRAAQRAAAKADAELASRAEVSRPVSSARPALSPSPSPSSSPGKKPIGAAIATAAIATLMGVAVTFGVITMLDRKPPSDAPPTTPSATTSTAAVTSAATSATTTTAPPSSSATSASVPSATATTSASAATTTTTTTTASVGKTAPTRSAPPPTASTPRGVPTKPLDIQRDLPK